MQNLRFGLNSDVGVQTRSEIHLTDKKVAFAADGVGYEDQGIENAIGTKRSDQEFPGGVQLYKSDFLIGIVKEFQQPCLKCRYICQWNNVMVLRADYSMEPVLGSYLCSGYV